ncbi:MAG: hypothetical protein SOU07_06310 [Bacilli bacterium]|nr:hypothetical protein [Bacilli bacterium]
MQNRDDLDKLYSVISTKLFQLDNEEFVKYFDKFYYSGVNSFYQKNMSQTKIFDVEWVSTVESYFPSLDRITKNPRSALRYEQEVVDVERAKKINSTSVRHLASHTHLIKDIDKEQNVIPKKILTINAEQEFNIYENRFIATLINRLFLFVRNRYLIIKENVESYQKDHVYTESKFDIDNVNVEMKIDLTVKKDLDNKEINEDNYALLERVEKLEQLVEALRNNQFMQMLKKVTPVRPPIMKTNIILKNPDFKNAYNLWLFLDKYSTLAYDIDVQEKNIEFTKDFEKQIKDLTLINFATILGNQSIRNELFNIGNVDTDYKKKRNKYLKENAKDFVDNPKTLQLEDTTLNEYFLNKYKELFKQSTEEIKEEKGYDNDEALKRALKKTTEIVNSLYEAIFKFEEEQNIFNYLVTEKNLAKEYEKKKYQLKFAKVIREIKEVDYNNSLRKEKKLLKEMEQLNKQIIKQKQNEIDKAKSDKTIAKLTNQINNKKQENETLKLRLEALNNNKELLDYEKDAVNELRTMASNQIKLEVNKYKEERKKQLEAKKQALFNELNALNQDTKDLKKLISESKKKRDKEFKNIKKDILNEYDNVKNMEQTLFENTYVSQEMDEINDLKHLIEETKEQQKIDLQLEKERIAIEKVKAYEASLKG